jgi:hypothetical protein
MIAVSVLAVLEAWKRKAIIDGDEISWQGVTSKRKLGLHEIKGYRANGEYIVIESNVPGKKQIKISQYITRTYEIQNWLDERVPNLDVKSAFDEHKAIMADQELGWTEEQRLEKLTSAKKIANAMNWIGGGIAAWAMFFPEPYEVAVYACLAFPLIAMIVIKSSKLIRIDQRTDSAYPSVFIGFFFPAIVLVLRAVFDFDLYEFKNLWLPGSIVAVLFLIGLIIGSSEFDFQKSTGWILMVSLLLPLMAYGLGAAIFFNCYYDRSNPKVYSVAVVDKRVSSGKSSTYYLKVTPWGPELENNELTVSSELYDRVSPRDSVYIYLRPGNLNAPWYIISRK